MSKVAVHVGGSVPEKGNKQGKEKGIRCSLSGETFIFQLLDLFLFLWEEFMDMVLSCFLPPKAPVDRWAWEPSLWSFPIRTVIGVVFCSQEKCSQMSLSEGVCCLRH